MKIEFDPVKDAKNIAKDGVSLVIAESLEWDLILATEDTCGRYGDIRMVGFAPIRRTVYYVVFTEEDDVYRIVSLRKALLGAAWSNRHLSVRRATAGERRNRLGLRGAHDE